MKKEKTHWYDEGLHKTYGDNNNGLVWGINYIDDDEVIECEWFKTRQERNKQMEKGKQNESKRVNKTSTKFR